MNKLDNLFKPFDEIVFKIVDDIRGIPPVRKLIESTQSLPESQQKIISQGIAFLVIALPLIAVILLFISNQNIRSQVAAKKEVLELISVNQSQKNTVSTLGSSLISAQPITSTEDLQSLIRVSLTSRSMNPSSVNITHFDQFQASSELTQTIATLSFSELSTAEFTNFMIELMQRQIKVQSIEIEKNPNSKYLQGSLEIGHFGRPGV